MNVRIRFFAVLREKTGESEVHLDVPDGTDIDALWPIIAARYPAIEPMAPSIAFAVNQVYVPRGTPLAAGDEIALIPPVSGG